MRGANQPGTQDIWWTNPVWVAGLMGVLVSLAAFLTPESMYMLQWRTPKYFDTHFLALSLVLTFLFVFGAWAPIALGKSQRPADWKRDLPWGWITRCFWFCVASSVAGYLVWAAVAIARGASLGLAMGVIQGQKGAALEMKDVYLGTISGVTTLTELGIAAVILGTMIGAVKGWKKVGPAMAILFALAAVRALFNSERLAILELAIPAVVIGTRVIASDSTRFRGRVRTAMQYLPIAAGGLFLAMFGIFEYFRSWSSYYAGGSQSFWEFVTYRLAGYYVTALNNGALMVSRIDPVGAPFGTLHFLWRFPLVSSVVQSAYPNLRLDNIDFDPYMQILDREANQEFNNQSALFPPIVDFGLPGALLFWLAVGLLCGLLYRWFLDGKAAGLMLYPIFFIGITETTRIMYWGEGRAVIAYFILVPLAWLCSTLARRAYRAERRLAWLPSR